MYVDFSKDFDKVLLLKLQRNLQRMGISGKIGHWIHSFLINREQAVMVNGVSSKTAAVKSGGSEVCSLVPYL